jgi:hypothetical protein
MNLSLPFPSSAIRRFSIPRTIIPRHAGQGRGRIESGLPGHSSSYVSSINHVRKGEYLEKVDLVNNVP